MSTYKIPDVNNRPPQLAELGYYADIRFDPDDETPDFIGLNVTAGAGTGSTTETWKVYKMYYADAASVNILEIRLGYGSWSGRASITGF